MTQMKTISRNVVLALTLGLFFLPGCGKTQSQGQAQNQTPGQAKPEEDMNKQLKEIIASLQTTKVPTTSNLTPAQAAQITHEVSMQSIAEFPKSQDIPKDPKELAALNERIRAKNEQIYTKYGTTMSATMRYISDLSPKDREIYNEKLTQLFLEQSKKNSGAGVMTPEPLKTPVAGPRPASAATSPNNPKKIK